AVALVAISAVPCSRWAHTLVGRQITQLALMPVRFRHRLRPHNIWVYAPFARRPLQYLVSCPRVVTGDLFAQSICSGIIASTVIPRLHPGNLLSSRYPVICRVIIWPRFPGRKANTDRKSTRLNSSHLV